MPPLAVTVVGTDRPGIVAQVTAALAALGGNLEDSSMTLLRGHFAFTLVVEAAARADEVADRLAFLGEQGLVVSVLPVAAAPAAAGGRAGAAPGAGWVLSVHGADRPGIVSRVTAVLADARGNITDLTTRLSGDLYVLVAEVELPAGTGTAALEARLREVGAGLGVDVALRPADVDDL